MTRLSRDVDYQGVICHGGGWRFMCVLVWICVLVGQKTGTQTTLIPGIVQTYGVKGVV